MVSEIGRYIAGGIRYGVMTVGTIGFWWFTGPTFADWSHRLFDYLSSQVIMTDTWAGWVVSVVASPVKQRFLSPMLMEFGDKIALVFGFATSYWVSSRLNVLLGLGGADRANLEDEHKRNLVAHKAEADIKELREKHEAKIAVDAIQGHQIAGLQAELAQHKQALSRNDAADMLRHERLEQVIECIQDPNNCKLPLRIPPVQRVPERVEAPAQNRQAPPAPARAPDLPQEYQQPMPPPALVFSDQRPANATAVPASRSLSPERPPGHGGSYESMPTLLNGIWNNLGSAFKPAKPKV